MNLVTILQVCDGIVDCPRSETSDDGEDEEDCEGLIVFNQNEVCLQAAVAVTVNRVTMNGVATVDKVG